MLTIKYIFHLDTLESNFQKNNYNFSYCVTICIFLSLGYMPLKFLLIDKKMQFSLLLDSILRNSSCCWHSVLLLSCSEGVTWGQCKEKLVYAVCGIFSELWDEGWGRSIVLLLKRTKQRKFCYFYF